VSLTYISPPDPWFVAMKVNWAMVKKVTMVVRFCKSYPVFSGLFQSFSDFKMLQNQPFDNKWVS
jgi:hypothetical protein